MYKGSVSASVDRRSIAQHLRSRITFLVTGEESLSPADMLLQLLGIEPQVVDGPTARAATTFHAQAIPRESFQVAVQDAADFVRRNHRLPNQVFIGAESLSLPDFTATLAAAVLSSSDSIPVTPGLVEFEKYFATDASKSFNWVIHPQGFAAPELLELGKLQGWTLKPALLSQARKKDTPIHAAVAQGARSSWSPKDGKKASANPPDRLAVAPPGLQPGRFQVGGAISRTHH